MLARLLKTTAGLAKDCRAGLRWSFCCRCPIKKVLDSSSKTLHGACVFDFFEKSHNELVWPFLMFMAFLPQ